MEKCPKLQLLIDSSIDSLVEPYEPFTNLLFSSLVHYFLRGNN